MDVEGDGDGERASFSKLTSAFVFSFDSFAIEVWVSIALTIFPDASFDVHLRRFPSEGTQNLEVPLYCAIGYVLTLPRSPGEVEALFKRGAEYHCEGCMSDITSTVRRRPAPRKRSE